MNAEDAIKFGYNTPAGRIAGMDGTFTRINQKTGDIEKVKVSMSYIPKYCTGNDARTQADRSAASRRGGFMRASRSGFTRWCDKDIDLLITLYNRGVRQYIIVKDVGKSRSAVQNKLRELRESGRIV